MSHIKGSHAAIEALMDAGNLSIIDADRESADVIVVAAKKTGDYGKLSKADISILALSRQTNATLISDDYAVANVAATVGVAVEMSSGKGVKNVRKYVTYCTACSKAFGPNAKECALCGNLLKRKYRVIG